MVMRNGGDSDEGVDLFQDALSILYQKASEGSFEVDGSMEAYIFGMCRKLWLMRLRKRGIERKYQEHLITDPEEQTSIEGALNDLQKEMIYKTSFKRLSEKCQELLKLFYKGKSFKEIAADLELSSEGYAKKLKFQCKQRLIDEIRKDPLYLELREE